MANIDINENVNLSADNMEHVKGGAAYIKFDGVDGEAKGEGKGGGLGGGGGTWGTVLSVRFQR